MKHKGCKTDYTYSRMEDIARAFAEYYEKLGGYKKNIYEIIARSKAKRYWVSEERAKYVIGRIERGDTLKDYRSTKRRMFFDIYLQYLESQKANPSWSKNEHITHVIHSQANQFYLEPSAIKAYHYQYLRNERAKKRHSTNN